MKKIWVILLFMCFLVAGFFVYQYYHPKPVVLQLAMWNDQGTFQSDLIRDFQKSHPDIKVELLRIPYWEYETKLKTQLASATTPDVIQVVTNNFPNLYSLGILASLNDYIKTDPTFPLNDFYPSLIEYFTISNHLYVVPTSISPIGLIYYNKNAFDAAKLTYPNDDWNWDDFLTTAKALTKYKRNTIMGKDEIIQYGFLDDGDMIEPWVYSSGASWVDNPNNPTRWTFNSPKFLQGFQFRADLILRYKVMFNKHSGSFIPEFQSKNVFLNGSAAMFLSYYGNSAVNSIKNFDWDVTLCPKGPNGVRGFSISGGGYGITSTCKNKKAAWELVSYLGGVEGEKIMTALGLSMPALQSVANSPAFLDGQKPLNKKVLLKAVSYGVYPPKINNLDKLLWEPARLLFDEFWARKITAEQTVYQLYDQVKDKPLNY